MRSKEPLFIDPRNGQTLIEEKGHLTNPNDGFYYPSLNQVPILFADLEKKLNEWRLSLQQIEAELDHKINLLKIHSNEETQLNPLTIERRNKLRKAYIQNKKELRSILQPLSLLSEGSDNTHSPMKLLIDRFSLNRYWKNIFRDWAWQTDENIQHFRFLKSVLNDQSYNQTLVLGAGAGRLAYDWHQANISQETICLDHNPLFALLGSRLFQGSCVTLTEIVESPNGLNNLCHSHSLQIPEKARVGIKYILADGLNPPVANSSFDCLLTPWFVDVIPLHPIDLATMINLKLKMNGHWIFFGSLQFENQPLVNQWSHEEVFDFWKSCGFQIINLSEATLPYLDNPQSDFARREKMKACVLQKTSEVKERREKPHFSPLAKWILDPSLPIPPMPSFNSIKLQNQVPYVILNHIDGQRSIQDLAQVVSNNFGLKTNEAVAYLQFYFSRITRE